MSRVVLQRLTAFALFCLLAGFAQAQTEWTRQFGTTYHDDVIALAIHNSCLYVTGNQGQEAYLKKFDRDGNIIWSIGFGTALRDYVQGMAVDNTGIYITGYTYGAYAGQGGLDIFVRKYDFGGAPLWRRQTGTDTSDVARGIAADASGVYIGGSTGGSFPGFYNHGGEDAFIQRYSAAGELLWTQQFGTAYSDSIVSVAAASSGIYIAGQTEGALLGQPSAGSRDSFVLKLDSSGNLLWTRQFGTTESDSANALVADAAGVYVGGTTAGVFPDQARMGLQDAFLRKYTASGDHVWTRQFGTATNDATYSLTCDSTGVYAAGATDGTLPTTRGAGGFDAYVKKYDADGVHHWTQQFGTAGNEYAMTLAVDATGIYVGGRIIAGSYTGYPNLGQADAYVRRMNLVSPLRFVTVRPCRILDTRPGQGTSDAFGPPSFTAKSTRTLPIPESPCGIPSSAHAYSLNVTAVPSEPLGYLTLWPAGESQPVASTLNSLTGEVVANAAIVAAGSNGAINVYSPNNTDLIIDIDGYFTDEARPQVLSFYTLDPCRAVDTRLFSGPFGPPSLAPGRTRNFVLPNASCRVPAWAAAYSLNATVVAKDALSFLTLWPAGQPRPFVSTLNAYEETVVANAAIVQAGNDAAISAYATDQTDLILDVNGFFGTPGQLGELTFRPLTPCRIIDTREPEKGTTLFAGETRNVAISGKCGVPPEAKAYALNLTVVPDTSLGFLTLWPTGATQPIVSTLNSLKGHIVANAALVKAGTNGSVSIYVTDPTHLIIDINGYFQ